MILHRPVTLKPGPLLKETVIDSATCGIKCDISTFVYTMRIMINIKVNLPCLYNSYQPTQTTCLNGKFSENCNLVDVVNANCNNLLRKAYKYACQVILQTMLLLPLDN